MHVVCPSALSLNPPSGSVDDLHISLTVDNVVLVFLVQVLCLEGIDDVGAPGLFILPDPDCIQFLGACLDFGRLLCTHLDLALVN